PNTPFPYTTLFRSPKSDIGHILKIFYVPYFTRPFLKWNPNLIPAILLIHPINFICNIAVRSAHLGIINCRRIPVDLILKIGVILLNNRGSNKTLGIRFVGYRSLFTRIGRGISIVIAVHTMKALMQRPPRKLTFSIVHIIIIRGIGLDSLSFPAFGSILSAHGINKAGKKALFIFIINT